MEVEKNITENYLIGKAKATTTGESGKEIEVSISFRWDEIGQEWDEISGTAKTKDEREAVAQFSRNARNADNKLHFVFADVEGMADFAKAIAEVIKETGESLKA